MAHNAAGKENKVYKLDIDGNPPIINGFNQNRTVLKNTAVKYTRKLIDCKAEGDPAPKITWIMPDNIFLTAPYYGSRINVHSNGTLEIRNVRPSDTAEFICMDTGKYRCAAKNKVGYIEKLVIFEVIQKPYILTRPKGIIQGIFGQSLFLHCLTDGIQPSISWTMPGGFVLARPQVSGRYHLMENGTLVVHETVIHDRGNYVCRSKNDAGEAVLSVPVVIIAYPPRITNGPPPTVRRVAGVPVYLTCVANGIPTPEVNWELPDRSILSTTGKERPVGTHSGNYKCIAFNYLGRDTRPTYMTLIWPAILILLLYNCLPNVLKRLFQSPTFDN
uniref:Ig-like domain-containing protein n=1 Tax=Cyprinus carpio TaxID=7962 RepID=A0A8C2GE35_CYPCA